MSRSNALTCSTVPLLFLLALALAPAPALPQVDFNPALLAGLEARSIGPAGMSGRVAAIDAVIADPKVIYVGAATGGVWRSDDAGATFRPIFDDQPVAAIGAVTIDQRSPDTVWVGTGEGNPRNSVSVGAGLFRTHDGGDSWERLGLENTERIHRIILHPHDRDTLWVCAMGRAWGENPERGVYRSSDRGTTWDQVLYLDEKTGCADLVADPKNPETLMAAMWQYRRFPHFFRSGGPSSGLYRTTDGGDTWTRATTLDGMPEGDLGRIGLAFAPSDPRIAYALVEAKESAMLRSEDGGRTWRAVNTDPNVNPRPFYYSDIRVDPQIPDRVYRLQSSLDVSTDGGRSFQTLAGFGAIHPDHHELWIHPENPEFLINGNDGGIGISRDRGGSWTFVRNLPLAQYYHVRVDNDVPYNVYGGLQDNGSWRGPSAIWERGFGGGIRNFHWTMVAFGDGFDTIPDPEDSTRGYAMSQGGNLSRWNIATGGGKAIRPDGPDDEDLRFNWNAGFAQDPFDPSTIYYGSQFVHKSTDRGESWSIISPDLTTDNEEWQLQDESGGLTFDVTAAENFTSILTIEPSPKERGVIWVGTDDGRVHVTRDGGANWESLEERAQGVPVNTWVPHITPSRHQADEAFVVFDNHRRSDWTPYAFRVSGYGATWTPLVDSDDVSGYVLKVEQDPVDENLLFVGTEFGLYVSTDGGDGWFKWTHGVPTVSVMDMALHPRDHDLVLGTHGRAIFILDDIAPLRGLSKELLDKPIHLFDIDPAQQYQPRSSAGELMPGSTEFRGENRAYGALITFSLNQDDLPHPDPDVERERVETKRLEQAERGEAASGEEEDSGEARAAMRRGGRGRGGPAGMGGRGGTANAKQAKVEILDGDEVIREWEPNVHLGVNRVVWNLRSDSFERPGRGGGGFFGGGGGPEVRPGTYTVRVSYGKGDEKVTAEGEVQLLADPRIQISDTDRNANWEAIQQAGALQEALAAAVTRIGDLRTDIQAVQKKASATKEDEEGAEDAAEGEQEAASANDPGEEDEGDGPAPLPKQAGDLLKALDELEGKIWTKPGTKGITARNKALNKVGSLLGSLQSSWEAPNPTQQNVMRQVTTLVEGLLGELRALEEGELASFREAVRTEGIELLPEMEAVTVGDG